MSESTGPKCRHCRRKKICRPMGLCWGCYYRPGVKEEYRDSKYGTPSEVGLAASGAADRPVRALQGSEEKVRELERRAALGMELWHELDGED